MRGNLPPPPDHLFAMYSGLPYSRATHPASHTDSRTRRRFAWGLLAAISTTALADVATPLGRRDAPMYHEFRQPEYPFAEATVDLRGLAPAANTNHVVPRALLLNLSPDVTVCFDTELLRVAAIWTGNSVSADSMAALSYADPLKKIRRGKGDLLPQPAGAIVAATGLYPGWQWEGFTHFDDPRRHGFDPQEFGRGPLSAQHSRWRGVEVNHHRARLHYLAANRAIIEDFDLIEANGEAVVQRTVTITPGWRPVSFIVAEKDGERPAVTVKGAELEWKEGRYLLAHIPGSQTAQTVRVSYTLPTETSIDLRNHATTRDDTAVATTSFVPGTPRDGLVVDELDLPYPNPWQRRIRPTDIDFWPNGDAAVVTFDGDVYRLSGLGRNDDGVTWRRIATGLNEPQSVRVRDGEVFVFSRLGIIHLMDTDSDGTTDFYACFSNGMLQSPQPRDYPASMVVQADGSLVITKGGIQETPDAPQAGRALWVSPDGRHLRVFADGLRNAYLSRDPASGLLTASDQQGNWVPATPLHLIREGGYYGFEPATDRVREPEPVPLWLPHRVAQSAIDPIWINDERLGFLNRSVLMVDYYRPGLIRILPDLEGPHPRAVGVPVDATFETPLLKGEVNPVDGHVYIVGMQIWGSRAPRIEGLSRLRVLPSPRPRLSAARVYQEGIWLRFDAPLDAAFVTQTANYAAESWDYQRTSQYGSGQFKSDGTPGTDTWTIKAVLVSTDQQSVFLVSPDVQPAMQLQIKRQRDDQTVDPIYFTVSVVEPFAAAEAGFGDVDFPQIFAAASDPHSASSSGETAPVIASVDLGREIVTAYGCVGCHSTDGATEGKSGPTWRGIHGSERLLDTGRTITADEVYLRTAILDPTAHVVAGYDPNEAGMPPYRGVINDADLQSIILFLKSL